LLAVVRKMSVMAPTCNQESEAVIADIGLSKPAPPARLFSSAISTCTLAPGDTIDVPPGAIRPNIPIKASVPLLGQPEQISGQDPENDFPMPAAPKAAPKILVRLTIPTKSRSTCSSKAEGAPKRSTASKSFESAPRSQKSSRRASPMITKQRSKRIAPSTPIPVHVNKRRKTTSIPSKTKAATEKVSKPKPKRDRNAPIKPRTAYIFLSKSMIL